MNIERVGTTFHAVLEGDRLAIRIVFETKILTECVLNRYQIFRFRHGKGILSRILTDRGGAAQGYG